MWQTPSYTVDKLESNCSSKKIQKQKCFVLRQNWCSACSCASLSPFEESLVLDEMVLLISAYSVWYHRTLAKQFQPQQDWCIKDFNCSILDLFERPDMSLAANKIIYVCGQNLLSGFQKSKPVI